MCVCLSVCFGYLSSSYLDMIGITCQTHILTHIHAHVF